MTLTVDQMARLDHLLDEAMDLDEAGRRRWLEALPAAHADLRKALESVFFQRDPEGLTLPKSRAEPQLFHAGQIVGPYELIRPLGQGGMAQVWLARRADGSIKREVALKIPSALHLRGDLAARFEREKDILAGLEHRNIARLYDAGATRDELPFLALEYVPGEPITAWCDARRLGVQERVQLFLQVLEAVEYAHKHGVLHRDIKPSNVLVTEDGQVRLLDFGIARLLEQETQLTREYGRALTPAYASPEQLKDEELDTSSDVYSLGVLLFHLLTGSTPHSTGTPTTRELDPPSTRVDAQAASARGASESRLRRALQGDLDAILCKALAPERTDRYTSAADFERDLGNYLDRRPVRARRRSLLYGPGRFLLRNWALASAVATAVLLLLGVITYEETRARRSADAEQAASATLKNSIVVLPFLDLSEKRDQEYFSDGMTEELIDRLAHVQDLQVISRTSAFSFKGKQVSSAEIGRTLHVGHILEGSVRKSSDALRIAVQLVRAADGTHVWSQQYDRKLADVFEIQTAIAMAVASDISFSVHRISFQPAAGENPDAYNFLLQGVHYAHQFHKETNLQALALFQKALEIDPNYAKAWSWIATCYRFQLVNSWAPPEEASRNLRAAAKKALELNPHEAAAYYNLAMLARGYDYDFNAMDEFLRKARESDPDNYIYKYMQVCNRFEEGDSGPIECSRSVEEAARLDPLNPTTLISLSYVYFIYGRPDDAVRMAREALLLKPDYEDAKDDLFNALVSLRRFGEAREVIEQIKAEDDRLFQTAILAWVTGRKTEAETAAKKFEREFANQPGDAWGAAAIRAVMGDADAAFRWLDIAYERRDPELATFFTDPYFSGLRKDPRFDALFAKLKLPPKYKSVTKYVATYGWGETQGTPTPH